MDSLNISLSNAIKRGTVEISGNANAVDETTLKQSDVTFMLSVKVRMLQCAGKKTIIF